VPGTADFVQSFRLANYLDYAREYATQFGRSFLYAGLATFAALVISFRWPT